MALVTNIVAADEDEAEAVAMSNRRVEEWTDVEARDIDGAKLATPHCLLGEDPAAGEDFEMVGWPVEESQSFVVDLADVARVAASECRIVPAWLRTVNG